MVFKIFKDWEGDRRIISIVFFIVILVLVTGITTPLLIDSKKASWGEDLASKTREIENGVREAFKKKEQVLIDTKNKLKTELISSFTKSTYAYRELISLVNKNEYKDYSVEIIAPNGKIIAWNNELAVEQDEIFPLSFPLNETHFYSSGLLTFLSIIDTASVENDVFYLIVSKTIEKHYAVQNKYFDELSFGQELSEEFNSPFNVFYDPFTEPVKDGRQHSFILLNYLDHKIGTVNFLKPSLNSSLTEISDISSKIQSVLIVLILVLMGVSLWKNIFRIKHRTLRLLSIIIFLSIVRLVFFWIGFPSRFIQGPLVDPAYFSSTFAGGLVKSPIEFLITNLFLAVIGFFIFRYTFFYFVEGKKNKLVPISILLTPALAILLFYVLRGFSASIKSVVFDSTIRYFKEPSLLPDMPSLVMNLNILILGFACTALMIGLLILAGKFLKLIKHGGSPGSLITYFVIIQISSYIFFEFIKAPLISHLLVIVFITLLFLLIYFLLFRRTVLAQGIIYTAVISSIITITLLNYFNLELEKRSLKLIAYEINRADEEFLKFLIDETLNKSVRVERVMDVFNKRNVNYDAEAFIIWSKSSLQRESLNSQVKLFDRNQNTLGRFSVGFDHEINFFDHFNSSEGTELNIKNIISPFDPTTKSYIGVIPVINDDIVLGYIGVATEYNIESISSTKYPDFLESNKVALGSVIDLNLINIFKFSDKQVSQVYGDVFPSREQQEQIFNTELSKFNEGWLTLSIYGENYITFVLKTFEEESEKITSVAIKEKELTWNLFNFFKIFIIHSIFILLLFILSVSLGLIKVQYSFRIKLLFAFMLISIIPIAALAVYNRQVVEERTETSIFDELSKRSNYLENHVRAQKQKHVDRDIIKAFDNAGKELGISFAVFRNSEQLYSSKKEYYDCGLFDSRLNSLAHYILNYLSYREYLTQERLNKFDYNAYYRKINIEGEPYIIGVNDAFNKIKLSYSTVDVDILLFGTYTFAVIIIVLLSTIFANQFSAPIRRLTKATESVARGDLSVQLENRERGELKGLFDGFNFMTNELQKNQIEIAELERENAWKEMAKQVAHEIKNPLTPMKLSIQQMIAAFRDKKKNFGDVFNKLSETVLNQIDNLSIIAAEFSTLAKMPSIKLEIFDLILVVKDTVNLFSDEKTKVILNTDLPDILIEADKSQLRRMLINLIRNSIEAKASRVELKIFLRNKMVELMITDDGIGISSENQDKIFQSNFTTKDKGMGIGLKLAKRFLENINGSVELFESSEDDTIFKILIPVYNGKQK